MALEVGTCVDSICVRGCKVRSGREGTPASKEKGGAGKHKLTACPVESEGELEEHG